MPCDQDHEHAPWPTEGEFELIIEACETQCGWCSYSTKHANNLRVHAHRHIANPKDGNLRQIVIVKGRAGRKRVHMTRKPVSTQNSTTSLTKPRQPSTKARSPIRRQSISQYPIANPWESRDAPRLPWEFSPELEPPPFSTHPAINMMLDTESEFRVKLSNVSSYASDLNVQTMKRADAFQHASEEETRPAALHNSNSNTSLATNASSTTGIPSGTQQRSPLIVLPEILYQVAEKFANTSTIHVDTHDEECDADAVAEDVNAAEEASDTEYTPKSTRIRKSQRRAFNQRVTSNSPPYEQREAQMKPSNMQSGRSEMPTQTDSQMRHSPFKSSFSAYPTIDETLRVIDDLLEFLQAPELVPTPTVIQFLEERNTVCDIMQHLRDRHCKGLLNWAEVKALHSGLQVLYKKSSLSSDPNVYAYWVVVAIEAIVREVGSEYYSPPNKISAIGKLKSYYLNFLGIF